MREELDTTDSSGETMAGGKLSGGVVTDELRKCDNCERVIGRFERTYDWQGHTVCRECRRRLLVMTPLPAAQKEATADRPAAKQASGPAAEAPRGEASEAAAPVSESGEGERTLWRGGSSQLTNLKVFAGSGVWCVLAAVGVAAAMRHLPEGSVRVVAVWGLVCSGVVAALVSCRQWLAVRAVRYEITSERLRTITGMLSHTVEEVELYRVKDTALLQPFFLRLFSLGHVVVFTSDRTTPAIIIRAVPKARGLRETIRTHAEKRRDAKRVREVDME